MDNIKYLRDNSLFIIPTIRYAGYNIEEVRLKLNKFKSWYINQLKLINDDEVYQTFQKTWEGLLNLVAHFSYGVSNTVTLGCASKVKKDLHQLMLMDI